MANENEPQIKPEEQPAQPTLAAETPLPIQEPENNTDSAAEVLKPTPEELPDAVATAEAPDPADAADSLPEPELDPDENRAIPEAAAETDEPEAEDEPPSEAETAVGAYRDILSVSIAPEPVAVSPPAIDLSPIENAQANLAQQVFDLSERISTISVTSTAIVTDLHKVSEETEQLLSWSQHVQVTSALSKTFQVIAISALLILIGGISFLGLLQYKAHSRLNATEAALAEALKVQQKRLADYDKHFSELVGKELHGELESRHKISLHERLNRLRAGNTEQKLYRKSTGDWFVLSGQAEQPVTDPDIIEMLNHAFIKSGKQMVTRTPAPPHKAWGLLRSNGRGGTDIVITSEVSQ